MHVSENQKFVAMNKKCKVDKAMWLVLLDCYNDKTIFLDENFLSSNTLYLFTDAALSKEFAGIYGMQNSSEIFLMFGKLLKITTLEFYPIILFIAIWRKLLANHFFVDDNESLMVVINKQLMKYSKLYKNILA